MIPSDRDVHEGQGGLFKEENDSQARSASWAHVARRPSFLSTHVFNLVSLHLWS